MGLLSIMRPTYVPRERCRVVFPQPKLDFKKGYLQQTKQVFDVPARNLDLVFGRAAQNALFASDALQTVRDAFPQTQTHRGAWRPQSQNRALSGSHPAHDRSQPGHFGMGRCTCVYGIHQQQAQANDFGALEKRVLPQRFC